MKIQEIEKYISDDILDKLFNARCDTLYNLTYYRQNKDYQKLKQQYPFDSDIVRAMVESLPSDFENMKKQFAREFDDFVTGKNLFAAYENEQFYKAGFCDGIRMILENIKTK